MTNRFKLLFIAASLFAAFALAACALPSPVPVDDGSVNVATDFTPNDGSTQQSASGLAVETTDMVGNAVRLSVYPESIVVLDPGDCEILYAIGAGNAVTGRTIDCDYPAEVNAIPYVTVDGKTDADLVLLRNPQLVIMNAETAADTELISALQGAGISFLVTNATDVNNLYGAIALLGTVTNHSTEANALVSQMITKFAEMQAKVSAHSETVYLELTPLESGLTTAGNGTVFNSLVSLLGYHNEFEDQAGNLSITQDQVIGRSPDIIITPVDGPSAADPATTDDPTATDDANAAPLSGSIAEILSRADWSTVDAVKNERVYYIDAGLITRAGPRILQGIDALYAALYESRTLTY